MPATKIEALVDLIAPIVASDHKALVFSQFTQFLSFVRARFNRLGWTYAYLDGATRRRSEVIRRFREDETTRIFLISLKAGGLGLNLAVADYCVLLDPWWNPAVEQQAIDRAHRIGQERPIMVYRLIAKDTIEEKVRLLQEKKKKLFESVFDEGAAFGSLVTETDIRAALE